MMMTSRAIPDFLFLQLHTRLIHNAAEESVSEGRHVERGSGVEWGCR